MLERLLAHQTLAIVVAVTYLGLVSIGFSSGNAQTAFYAALLPTLALLVVWLDSRRPFPGFVLWGLALWGALHMAGGLIPATDERVLYNVWLLPFIRFDHAVHAIGFGFAGLAFWAYLRADLAPGAGGAALAFMGGVGIGGLNEMVEFLISQAVSGTNIGGFENTGWDLVANLAGASAAAMWVRVRHRPRTTVIPGRS